MKVKKTYAYIIPDTGEKGISDDWWAVKEIIKGKDARFKGFEHKLDALRWIDHGCKYNYGKDKSKHINGKDVEKKQKLKKLY